MSKFLIELSGSSKGYVVTPTVGIQFSSRKGGDYYVDLNALESSGYDGFLRVANGNHTFNLDRISFGMSTYVQIELPYPWSKHDLYSNVPIKSFCKSGYFISAIRFICCKIKQAYNWEWNNATL